MDELKALGSLVREHTEQDWGEAGNIQKTSWLESQGDGLCETTPEVPITEQVAVGSDRSAGTGRKPQIHQLKQHKSTDDFFLSDEAKMHWDLSEQCWNVETEIADVFLTEEVTFFWLLRSRKQRTWQMHLAFSYCSPVQKYSEWQICKLTPVTAENSSCRKRMRSQLKWIPDWASLMLMINYERNSRCRVATLQHSEHWVTNLQARFALCLHWTESTALLNSTCVLSIWRRMQESLQLAELVHVNKQRFTKLWIHESGTFQGLYTDKCGQLTIGSVNSVVSKWPCKQNSQQLVAVGLCEQHTHLFDCDVELYSHCTFGPFCTRVWIKDT